jgi:hypothetical protein
MEVSNELVARLEQQFMNSENASVEIVSLL